MNNTMNEIMTQNNSRPTWEEAAQIYMAVLANPEAEPSSRANARAEILILARVADRANADRREMGKVQPK